MVRVPTAAKDSPLTSRTNALQERATTINLVGILVVRHPFEFFRVVGICPKEGSIGKDMTRPDLHVVQGVKHCQTIVVEVSQFVKGFQLGGQIRWNRCTRSRGRRRQ